MAVERRVGPATGACGTAFRGCEHPSPRVRATPRARVHRRGCAGESRRRCADRAADRSSLWASSRPAAFLQSRSAWHFTDRRIRRLEQVRGIACFGLARIPGTQNGVRSCGTSFRRPSPDCGHVNPAQEIGEVLASTETGKPPSCAKAIPSRAAHRYPDPRRRVATAPAGQGTAAPGTTEYVLPLVEREWADGLPGVLRYDAWLPALARPWRTGGPAPRCGCSRTSPPTSRSAFPAVRTARTKSPRPIHSAPRWWLSRHGVQRRRVTFRPHPGTRRGPRRTRERPRDGRPDGGAVLRHTVRRRAAGARTPFQRAAVDRAGSRRDRAARGRPGQTPV